MSDLPRDPFFDDGGGIPAPPDPGEAERLERLRQELLERERYLQEFQSRLEDEARGADAPASPLPAYRKQKKAGTSPRTILVAAACLTLILSVMAWFSQRPPVQVTGTITAGAGASDLLAACERRLADQADISAVLDRTRGQLSLRSITADGTAGADRINRLGRQVVEEVRDATLHGTATRPASEGDLKAIESELADIDRRLEALGVAPLSEVKGPLSMATWKSMMEERRSIQAQLSEISGMIARPAPTESTLVIDPDRLQATRAADQRLQADLVGLRQRQNELVAALSDAMRAGDTPRQTLSPALASARTQLEEIRARTGDSQAAAHVAAILKVLERWSNTLVALDRAWSVYSSEQGGPPGLDDLLERRTGLEEAGTRLVDATREGLTQVAEELERLVQGGDEPAKRLVLRNSLVRELRPVLEAQRSLAAAVMAMLPEHHRPLAGLYESVIALRNQVRGHEARIQDEVRARMRDELLVEHDKMRAQLLADQERLRRRDMELDAALMENAEKALAALVETGRERSAILQQMELYRQRGQLLDRLSEATQQMARRDRHTLTGLVQLAYVPAETQVLPIPAGQRIGRSMLVGIWPLVIAGVVLAVQQGRRRRSGVPFGRLAGTARASTAGESRSEA